MVRVFDRSRNEWFSEKVLGGKLIAAAYENPLFAYVREKILTRATISRLYGKWMDLGLSARSIPGFIRDFSIPMREFENIDYPTFNDFFIRKFVPGARSFPDGSNKMGAFAEGRYFVFDSISGEFDLPIKGATIRLKDLLADDEEAKRFEGGTLFLARLCPVDYHRFHFPDNGKTLKEWTCSGPLESVHPIAISKKGDLLFTNERSVSILETQNFGRLAYIEVGALFVGRIQQTHSKSEPFKRGSEKGYFQFGGSTVILIAEKGKLHASADLLTRTREGFESLVRLGEEIGTS